jgi:hypothetical protein
MIMCKDEECKEPAKLLLKPVVEVVFSGNAHALENLDTYTVNHYETGNTVTPHQDYVDGTVMIVTAFGTRELDIYRKEEDVFLSVDTTYTLEPGSVLCLNGYIDFGHTARCIVGPSISFVGNVPDALPA